MKELGSALQTEKRASLASARPSRGWGTGGLSRLGSRVSMGLLSLGGGQPLPCTALCTRWTRPSRQRGGSCLLTSGNRKTLQYFTPLRSLGGESGRREHPERGRGGRVPLPPQALCEAEFPEEDQGEDGDRKSRRSLQNAHTYFLHRSQLYMLSPGQ